MVRLLIVSNFYFLKSDTYWLFLMKRNNAGCMIPSCRYDVASFLSHRSLESGDPVIIEAYNCFGVHRDLNSILVTCC